VPYADPIEGKETVNFAQTFGSVTYLSKPEGYMTVFLTSGCYPLPLILSGRSGYGLSRQRNDIREPQIY